MFRAWGEENGRRMSRIAELQGRRDQEAGDTAGDGDGEDDGGTDDDDDDDDEDEDDDEDDDERGGRSGGSGKRARGKTVGGKRASVASTKHR